MPRHKTLIPLSQEHHHTLVLALRLKKGGPTTHKDLWPTDLKSQIEQTIEYCDGEILPHFELEERTIFPIAKDLETAKPIIETLLTDHEDLRQMIAALPGLLFASEDNAKTALRALGERLEKHIRKEERDLFPLLESELSGQDWTEIGRGS
jgi:hemerythrin-like domain-containing protein